MRFAVSSVAFLLSWGWLGAEVARAGDTPLEQVWGAEPFAVPAEVLRTAVAPKLDGGAVVLLSESSYRYDAEHRLTRAHHVVVRVVDARGIEEWGTVRMGWAPWQEARPEVRARVVTADGRELKLDPATVSEATSSSQDPLIVSDRRELVVPIPGVARGATIEITMETRATQTAFGAPGVAGRHVFQTGSGVSRQRVTVAAPAAGRLAWRGFGLEARGVTPTVREVGGVRLVEVIVPAGESGDRGAAETPRVLWSTGGTWKEMATTYRAQVDKALARRLPPEAVPSGIGGARLEKADAVLRALQARVRYTGLELGDAAVVPYAPAVVWEREYGDCKDMAVALVDALGRVGIAGKVALLDVGAGDDVIAELPGLDLFDHAIVYVPAAGREAAFWIDPTAQGLGAGVLPAGDLERLALVIDAASTTLTPTPKREQQPAVFRVETTVTLPDHGEASVDEVVRYEGLYASFPRQSYVGVEPAELAGKVAWLAEGHGAKAVDRASVESTSGAVTIRARIDRAPNYETGWSESTIEIPAYMPLDFVPQALQRDEAAGGAGPFRFALASRLSGQVTLRVPRGFVVAAGLGDEERRFGPATWKQSIKRVTRPDGRDEVVVAVGLDFGKVDYSADDVNAFAVAYREFSRNPKHRVVLRHEASALIAGGQISAGLEKLRAQLAKDPKDAVTRARLAIVLADLGVGRGGAPGGPTRAGRCARVAGGAHRGGGCALDGPRWEDVGHGVGPGRDGRGV